MKANRLPGGINYHDRHRQKQNRKTTSGPAGCAPEGWPRHSRPIEIPPDIAAKCDGPNQFEKVDRLFRSVISVPKATIDEAEQKWKQERARKRAKKTA